MTTATAAHGAILDALTASGLYAVFGPADDLPTGGDGLIAQAAVLWPSPGLYQYTRTSGDSSGRGDAVTVICVGATVRDALAVADKVEAAIGGMRLSPKGGPLRQTVATRPAAEPNADPVRVSMAVEYTATTKG